MFVKHFVSRSTLSWWWFWSHIVNFAYHADFFVRTKSYSLLLNNYVVVFQLNSVVYYHWHIQSHSNTNESFFFLLVQRENRYFDFSISFDWVMSIQSGTFKEFSYIFVYHSFSFEKNGDFFVLNCYITLVYCITVLYFEALLFAVFCHFLWVLFTLTESKGYMTQCSMTPAIAPVGQISHC